MEKSRMNIKKIIEILEAKVIEKSENSQAEVRIACGADLMSDT